MIYLRVVTSLVQWFLVKVISHPAGKVENHLPWTAVSCRLLSLPIISIWFDPTCSIIQLAVGA